MRAIGPVDVRRLQQVVNSDETTVRVAVSMLERAELLAAALDVPQEIEITLRRKLPANSQADARSLTAFCTALALQAGQVGAFSTQDIGDLMGWRSGPMWNAGCWNGRARASSPSRRASRAMLIELPPAGGCPQRLRTAAGPIAALAQRRIDDVVGYAAENCRHGYISAHFGSSPAPLHRLRQLHRHPPGHAAA